MRKASLLFAGLAFLFSGALGQAVLKKAPHWVLPGGWDDPARSSLANVADWVSLLGLLLVVVRALIVWWEARVARSQENAPVEAGGRE